MTKKTNTTKRQNTFGEKLETLALTQAFPYKRELLQAIKETVKEFKSSHGLKPNSITCEPSVDDSVVCTVDIKSTAKTKK